MGISVPALAGRTADRIGAMHRPAGHPASRGNLELNTRALRRVAIIDDQQINLTLMQAMVRKIEDCEPVCFADSREGLAWCMAENPDLIVVDYMMPGLDGIEVIRQLRAMPERRDTPLLMVTADHERSVRHAALEAGATDFLTKPVDRIEFISRARNMLELRRSQMLLADRAALLAEEVREATEVIRKREEETLFCLARAAEFRDPETGAHILRMANYSRLIAARLGWNEADQDRLLRAAPMHDLGKLGTPDGVLLKPGKLTPDEFEIMKQHAVIGWEILRSCTSDVLQMGAEIALSHHEKFDGSGYPKGLAGDAIPWSGRIVAVADVFDALTSNRPYKKAWPIEQAVSMLREGAGKHFDPRCVECFLADMDAVMAIHDRYQDEDIASAPPNLSLT